MTDQQINCQARHWIEIDHGRTYNETEQFYT